jgi:hypothetical protein
MPRRRTPCQTGHRPPTQRVPAHARYFRCSPTSCS